MVLCSPTWLSEDVKSSLSPFAGADIQADFEDTPMLGQKQWREELQYDAITCMFAIHYFFESEKAIKTFLHNVSINLREGSLNTP